MAQVPLRELRRYGVLFQEARDARDIRQLARIADRTDRQTRHWLLRESMKEELAEQARRLGAPCRADSEHCFDYLLEIARPQLGLFRESNAPRDQVSASLTDWAIARVREVVRGHRQADSFETRVETDDLRPLDIELSVENFWPHLGVMGHFSGPVADDAAAEWAGIIELDIRIDEHFEDWEHLRAVIARTLRHELEHAHDVGLPPVPVPDGLSDLEMFRRYILSPREISAWCAHIADEARRERLPLGDLLDGNQYIIEQGALERGATQREAEKLAVEAISEWRREVARRA